MRYLFRVEVVKAEIPLLISKESMKLMGMQVGWRWEGMGGVGGGGGGEVGWVLLNNF